jgi:hypothetical protein
MMKGMAARKDAAVFAKRTASPISNTSRHHNQQEKSDDIHGHRTGAARAGEGVLALHTESLKGDPWGRDRHPGK